MITDGQVEAAKDAAEQVIADQNDCITNIHGEIVDSWIEIPAAAMRAALEAAERAAWQDTSTAPDKTGALAMGFTILSDEPETGKVYKSRKLCWIECRGKWRPLPAGPSE